MINFGLFFLAAFIVNYEKFGKYLEHYLKFDAIQIMGSEFYFFDILLVMCTIIAQ